MLPTYLNVEYRAGILVGTFQERVPCTLCVPVECETGWAPLPAVYAGANADNLIGIGYLDRRRPDGRYQVAVVERILPLSRAAAEHVAMVGLAMAAAAAARANADLERVYERMWSAPLDALRYTSSAMGGAGDVARACERIRDEMCATYGLELAGAASQTIHAKLCAYKVEAERLGEPSDYDAIAPQRRRIIAETMAALDRELEIALEIRKEKTDARAA